MGNKRPTSPHRDFKINFINEPPLKAEQINFIVALVPKIASKHPSALKDIQQELCYELCKYLDRDVGVLIESNQNVLEPFPEPHSEWGSSCNFQIHHEWILVQHLDSQWPRIFEWCSHTFNFFSLDCFCSGLVGIQKKKIPIILSITKLTRLSHMVYHYLIGFIFMFQLIDNTNDWKKKKKS